jgi:inhibitor of KinA sporulation pathway (predicted exonuclease)
MNDIVIDIETTDTAQTAKILSIGAVIGDLATGEVKAEFYEGISRESQPDRTDSLRTLEWWSEQEAAARDEAFNGSRPLTAVLKELKYFVNGNGGVHPWGNGATFDVSIIENAYQQYRAQPPWQFWNVRDARTLEALAPHIRTATPFEGVEHTALDDARHEFKYLSATMQHINAKLRA